MDSSGDGQLPSSVDPVEEFQLDPLPGCSSSSIDSSQVNTTISEQHETVGLKYPKVSVTAIVTSSSLERFYYYGLTTILTLYLSDVLGYDEDEATTFYHNFIQLCCTFSVVGAMLADSVLNKLKALIRFGVINIIGAALLFMASLPNFMSQRAWSQTAIFIIAVGSGGLRPCVPAFGGDQFVRPHQDSVLEQFFSILHYTATITAFIAIISMPILRAHPCNGQIFCFPLAFGVQGIFILLSFIVFLAGIKFYTVHPNQGKITRKLIRCILHALRMKIKNRKSDVKRDHWLDYAEDQFEREFLDEVKQYLRVLLVLVSAPMFWALFEQQGSRWIFQASRMNGVLGSITIEPDQMLILSPLIILIMAPTLDFVIYPLFGEKLTPLRKMGAGGFLAGVAFILAAVVELQIEPTYAKIPKEGLTTFNFINSLPCPVRIDYNDGQHFDLNATSFTFQRDLKDEPIHITAKLLESCQDVAGSAEWTGVIQGESTEEYSVVITLSRNGSSLELVRMEEEDPIEKLRSGDPQLKFILSMENVTVSSVVIASVSEEYRFGLLTNESSTNVVETDDRAIENDKYDVFVELLGTNGTNTKKKVGEILAEQGGSYVTFIQHRFSQEFFLPIVVTTPSSVHMLWLVPQFFVLTVAEILFSVTGMHFTFIESPVRMRTFLQAAWLFSGSIGNTIVIAVAETRSLPRQAMEYFLFAGLMGLDLILFIVLAVRYEYVTNIKDPPKLVVLASSSIRR